MFTTYNCNLLLQFQVFDNVSLAKTSRTIVSFHPRNFLFHSLFSLSLSYTYILPFILFLLFSQLHHRYA